MQLDQDWLKAQGEDHLLLRLVGTAFPEDKPRKIGVAVSGGGDSMALLHLYMRLAKPLGIQIAAVTVDHTLRDGSAAEAQGVANFCAQRGIPHTTLAWDTWDGHGNIQAAARDARYAMIAAWAKAHAVDAVVLGHTKDDSAETFIMRLARKAGIDGLALMEPEFNRNGMRWARPLWLNTRAELRAYLQRNDLPWVDDPSNDNTDFERVRVRKALDVLNDLGISTDAIHHSAMAARDARAALEEYTEQEAAQHVTCAGGDVIMQFIPLVPVEIGRRLRSKAVQWVGRLDYPPRQSTMRELNNGLLLDGVQTAGGCLVTRKENTLRIAREHNAVRHLTCPTDQLWDKRWQLTGPHAPDLHIAALGEAVKDCPDWRETGMPRTSLLATPAIWCNDSLIAAPLAGLQNGWTAQIVADFHSSLLTH